jgi:hypothetical protein
MAQRGASPGANNLPHFFLLGVTGLGGISGRKKLKPFSAAKIDSIPLAVLDSAALSYLLQPRTALSE